MASSIQRRRGTTSDHATFTGAVGEITIDTTKDTVVVHDGAVVGGVPLLREDLGNLPAGAVGDVKLATIATAGKVSNSATTAASANTPSAIVARDESNNFTAGTITAALTGAASSNVLKAGDTMTGALVVPLGAFGTPSLTFTGDLNTGIYSPGADQLAVATNGTSSLYIDATGNVFTGKGTTATILGGTTAPGGGLTDKDLTLSAWRPASGTNEYAGDLYLTVGPGTGNGSGKLGTVYIQVGKTGSPNNSPGSVVTALSADYSTIIAKTAETERLRITSTGTLNFKGAGTAGSTQAVSFDGSAPVNSVVLDSSGRLGIGTSSPTSSLHVYEGSTTNTNQLLEQASTAGAFTEYKNGTSDFYVGVNNSVGTLFSGIGGAYGSVIASFGAYPLAFGANNSERLRITSTGALNFVGAGTAGSTQAVSFNGSAPVNSLVIDSSGRLLVGTGTSPSVGIPASALFVVQGYTGVPTGDSLISLQRGQAPASITSGAQLGGISFGANDGSPYAQIHAATDGAGAANDYPGRLVFSTTADGAASPTERMRITSGGAVRIGSAISITPYDSLSSGTLSFEGSAGQLFSITNNLTTGSIFSVNDVSGIPSIDVNAAGTISLGAYGGNVGIGTSTPSSKLHVIGNLEVASANTDVFKIHRTGMAASGLSSSIAFQVTQTNAQSATLASITAEFMSNWAGDLIFSTKPANGTPNNTVTERMRITSGGDVLINATSTTGMATGSSVNIGTAIGAGVIQSQVNGNANQYWSKASGYTAGDFTAHYVNNTYVGGISTNGSATTYATSSDYRLKENVVPLTGAIDRVNNLQVHRFNFIINPGHTVDGFLAHEAQAVVPECVTGTKDEVDADGNPVYQGIDQSKLVPLLTAALQEAIGEIESLKARLTAAGI